MRPIGVIKTEGLCWFLWGFGVEDSCGGGTKLVMGLIFSRLKVEVTQKRLACSVILKSCLELVCDVFYRIL